MTYHFPRMSYLADLQKTYENLITNLGKILRSFENRVPDLAPTVTQNSTFLP